MYKGTFVKEGKVYEIYQGNGLIELVPEVVEPGEPMKPVDAPFYFFAKKQPVKQSILRNVLICAATVAPFIMLSAFGDKIMNDNLFGGLCWSAIAWAGFVVFANCTERRRH